MNATAVLCSVNIFPASQSHYPTLLISVKTPAWRNSIQKFAYDGDARSMSRWGTYGSVAKMLFIYLLAGPVFTCKEGEKNAKHTTIT